MNVLLLACLAACALAVAPDDGAIPADKAPGFVPLGAYLSWERIDACASASGIDRWDDATRRLDALQANHVNLLWVTNMSEADLPRLIDECAKRSILLLPSMGSIEAKVDWRWADGGAYYDAAIPSVVKAAGGSKTLAGWVLSDEPLEEHFPRLETLRDKFRAADPDRFCTSVLMWGQAPKLSEHVKLPVVCVDLYPFFGPNDPNGPHTDASSKAFYRNHAQEVVASVEKAGTVAWIMGMCFSDIWGPRKYDEKGHLIGLPGSYLHWRAPTQAEMRWQVWESFRSGGKGFVCYTLAPEAPDAATATAPPAGVEWKDVLAKEETDLGPNALTNPDCSATPQLVELGRLYERIAPHNSLIRRWQRSDSRCVSTKGDGQLQVFTDPETKALYAVIVNDNLNETSDIRVQLSEEVASLVDVGAGKPVALGAEEAGDGRTATLRLDAGDGTIVSLTQIGESPTL